MAGNDQSGYLRSACVSHLGLFCLVLQVVSLEEGESVGREYGIKCFECSAKANIGVEDSFVSLAKDVKERLTVDVAGGGARGAATQKLTPGSKPAGGGGGGCC